MAEKKSKSGVGFEHPAKGPNHCGMCRHFLADEHACRLVAGRVESGDWCRLFKRKSPLYDKS